MIELAGKSSSEKNLAGFKATEIVLLDRIQIWIWLLRHIPPDQSNSTNTPNQSDLESARAMTLKEFLKEFRKSETSSNSRLEPCRSERSKTKCKLMKNCFKLLLGRLFVRITSKETL